LPLSPQSRNPQGQGANFQSLSPLDYKLGIDVC
jgi:hypothetical protein